MLTWAPTRECCIVLAQGLLDKLSDAEILDVLGRECGRIQNGHVPFGTALHYLTHARSTLVRWAVRPATLSLGAWAVEPTSAPIARACCAPATSTSRTQPWPR